MSRNVITCPACAHGLSAHTGAAYGSKDARDVTCRTCAKPRNPAGWHPSHLGRALPYECVFTQRGIVERTGARHTFRRGLHPAICVLCDEVNEHGNHVVKAEKH